MQTATFFSACRQYWFTACNTNGS